MPLKFGVRRQSEARRAYAAGALKISALRVLS